METTDSNWLTGLLQSAVGVGGQLANTALGGSNAKPAAPSAVQKPAATNWTKILSIGGAVVAVLVIVLVVFKRK